MFDSNDLDAYFVQRLCFEKWNIVRTDVMKELPFPEPNEKLKVSTQESGLSGGEWHESTRLVILMRT